MRSHLMAIGALAALSMVGSAHAATEIYTATMDGAKETPPNTTVGYGQATVTLDTDSKVATYNLSYMSLSGPAAAAHFHAGLPGAAGPPVVPITGDLSSPIVGKATLTDAQIADLRAGKWYVNVHTAANKGGEIRGQVTAVDLSTKYLNGFGPSTLPSEPANVKK